MKYIIPKEFKARIISRSNLPESFHHSIHASIDYICTHPLEEYMTMMDKKMTRPKYMEWSKHYLQHRPTIKKYAEDLKNKAVKITSSPGCQS